MFIMPNILDDSLSAYTCTILTDTKMVKASLVQCTIEYLWGGKEDADQSSFSNVS